MLNLTVADALYAYAVTGSAFATVMILAAPHLEMFAHGKGWAGGTGQPGWDKNGS